MLTVHPEIVIDRNRKPKAVLLPYSEWNRVVADMEELEDIRAYDRAKARGDEAIPFEAAVKELKKKSTDRRNKPPESAHSPTMAGGTPGAAAACSVFQAHHSAAPSFARRTAQ